MRIVHVITRLIIGGAQENTLLSCQGQHDLGHDVTLITGPAIGPEGSLMDRAAQYGYRVIVVDEMKRAINPWLDTRVYFRLVHLLRGLRPDLVHTHSSKAGILGRWAARAAGAPAVVHTIHGLAFTASTNPAVNLAYQILEWQAAPRTDRIICVADAMRDQSLGAHIGSPEQYVTVYSGMDVQPFLNPPVGRDQVRKDLGIAPQHVVIGTIARLFDLKGHDDLLEVAPQLCAQLPNARFLWVGDGSLRPQFERRMADMGLRDRFILTGMVPPSRVPELTGAMDLLVHPSRREGLARALPQAALAGIPAISYDIDGAKEAVLHDITGFVYPPFARQQMLSGILKLGQDAPLRREMGRRGRAFALTRFDARVMIEALGGVYRDVTAHRD